MLFNSAPFIYGFLPISLLGFYVIGRRNCRLAAAWLAIASVFFYGWWNPRYVLLLLASVTLNYCFGWLISTASARDERQKAKAYLIGAITANLLVLAYYKYANFFIDAVGAEGLDLQIILPLGISFFTFTQIAFLVDASRGKAREYSLVHYMLFVTYFPHLIAGPILHHGQMMPQFADERSYRLDWTNIAVGFTIFVLGLGKKVFIADHYGEIGSPIFAAVAHGMSPTLTEAWVAALAYSLQLYFDFSAYCDMAIGLSLLFNIRLPLNFNSPYKAVNIIDFWRRWHMTLSQFLRDYLYIPLGGNRHGVVRRYANLMITMVLGGLWHGAGWTFVAWGALHGAYLIICHIFQALVGRDRLNRYGLMYRIPATLLTFVSVVVAWVFFRSPDFNSTLAMLQGMVGANGLGIGGDALSVGTRPDLSEVGKLALGLGAVWFLPNTVQLFAPFRPVTDAIAMPPRWSSFVVWRPNGIVPWLAVGVLFGLCLMMISPSRVSEFLYFQF